MMGKNCLGKLVFLIVPLIVLNGVVKGTDSNPTVTSLGSWNVDGYNISLVDKCTIYIDGRYCPSWSTGSNIFIVVPQTISEMQTSCQHEQCHVDIRNSGEIIGNIDKEEQICNEKEKIGTQPCLEFIGMVDR